MLFYLLMASVVICVSGLIFGASMLIRGNTDQIEDRLQTLTQNRGRGVSKNSPRDTSVLKSPLDDVPSAMETFFSNFLNLRAYIEQSGLSFSPTAFIFLTLGLGAGASVIYCMASPILSLTPVVFLLFGSMPFIYVWFVRRKRLKRFQAQLPEALDLMSQALRAGQSLPSGIHLVAQQMADPLGPEFHRAYEQQNLGVPLEQSLTMMTERVPNLDLRFFATAVVLQRQTGGDLAEILDKISNLIRQRFQIWGQIQALTGEGRLSGIVLLALPPALFLAMLKLNYDYIMMLFEEPLGHKMLIFAIITQIIGAIAIKKIITIKV